MTGVIEHDAQGRRAKSDAARARPRGDCGVTTTEHKRSPATRERILQAIRLGMDAYRAAAAAGITLGEFAAWCEADAAFAAGVERARTEMVSASVQNIRRAAQSDPKAAVWLRERGVA